MVEIMVTLLQMGFLQSRNKMFEQKRYYCRPGLITRGITLRDEITRKCKIEFLDKNSKTRIFSVQNK